MQKKSFLLLILGFLSFGAAKAQYVTIPDNDFRSYLMTLYPTCFNSAMQMDTTCTAVTSEIKMSIPNNINGVIKSIEGVKYFKSLKKLVCDADSLAALPTLPNSIEEINLQGSYQVASIANMPRNLKNFYISSQTLLTSLPADIQFTRLDSFHCPRSLFTSLPPLPSTLQYLDVSNGKLTSLPRLDTLPRLIEINCANNKLTTIPALRTDTTPGIYQYYSLNFSGNLLTSLPAFNSTIGLDISNNKFTSWPVFPLNVDYLDCSSNPINVNYLPAFTGIGPSRIVCKNLNLPSIPALPVSVTFLDCSNNPITALTNHSGVQYLNCSGTLITSLPNLSIYLISLDCSNNNISTLPAFSNYLQELKIAGTKIKCLPKLPTSLQTLYLNAYIKCIPNSGSNLSVYDSNGYLFQSVYCNATNNANACQAFPVIQGKVFFDLNSNGILDAGEYGKKNFKVSLSNGAFTFTNNSGFYQVSPDTLSSVSITFNPPALFNASPSGRAFGFTTNDTMVVQNVALQPIRVKDSIVVYLQPTIRPRPGFSFGYDLSYQNFGTTNLSNVQLVMHYDTALLSYNSASNSAVVHTGNTLSLITSSLLPIGGSYVFGTYFSIKNTAPLGTLLTANCAVTSGNAFSSDTSAAILVGSFDPNDKTATAKLTPAQLAADGYIDYVIRFQNTGTDTAIHVVLADTLSSKLRANTLLLIATSHSCKTTVKDKVVTFEMRNIMLSDSNVNEPASHGYVRFKVKPVTGLVVGDAITNKASIYFDYNSPVVTNSAVTQVAVQAFPLTLLSFTAKKENNTNLLNWKTAAEENVSHFEIERSGNGRAFNKIGAVKAGQTQYSFTDEKPATRNTNYYRLKMIDKDGQFTYSPIRSLTINHSSLTISIYPNPTKDILQVQIESEKKSVLQVVVLSGDGKIVLSKSIVANEGSTLQSINISTLPKGNYLLKVSDGNKGEIVLKFEKL